MDPSFSNLYLIDPMKWSSLCMIDYVEYMYTLYSRGHLFVLKEKCVIKIHVGIQNINKKTCTLSVTVFSIHRTICTYCTVNPVSLIDYLLTKGKADWDLN